MDMHVTVPDLYDQDHTAQAHFDVSDVPEASSESNDEEESEDSTSNNNNNNNNDDNETTNSSSNNDENGVAAGDRKSTRLNSSHVAISYAVFCLKKKKHKR